MKNKKYAYYRHLKDKNNPTDKLFVEDVACFCCCEKGSTSNLVVFPTFFRLNVGTSCLDNFNRQMCDDKLRPSATSCTDIPFTFFPLYDRSRSPSQ